MRSWLYPAAFFVAALLLSLLTSQIVDKLASETVATKLQTIAETTGTGLRLWAQQHLNVVDYVASDESFTREIKGQSSFDKSQDGITDALEPILHRFGFSGFVVLDPQKNLLSTQGLSSEHLDFILEENHSAQRILLYTEAHSRPAVSVTSDGGSAVSFSRSIAFFKASIRDDADSTVATLVLALPSEKGLNDILMSANIGDFGTTFIVDLQGTDLAGQRHRSLDELDGFAPFLESLEDSSQPASVLLNGLQDADSVELAVAAKRLDFFDAVVVTMMHRDAVFAASLALKRILLLIFGLGLLGACMNWVYLYRLSLLRSRVDAAKRKIQKLGQYNLEEKLGEGGMGVVYRASHSLLQRPTAVKLILPDRVRDRTIESFENEVMLTSRLTHPNTIAIYDYGRTEEGVFYYAMEYLDGIDLATLVENEGPQPWPRVIHILRQVCASLSEAHETGLIHRDIKPENVMLCKRGNRHDVVKVLDFGLAGEFSTRSSHDSSRVQGTPAYMAPETITHPDQIDVRIDIYAVGAVGYFLLCGRHIFGGDSVNAILSQQLNSKPIPISQRRPDVPESLQALIMDCLQKDPSQRPVSVEEFAERVALVSEDLWTEEDAKQGWLNYRDPGQPQARTSTNTSPKLPKSISKTIDFDR